MAMPCEYKYQISSICRTHFSSSFFVPVPKYCQDHLLSFTFLLYHYQFFNYLPVAGRPTSKQSRCSTLSSPSSLSSLPSWPAVSKALRWDR